jgi:hypothetical protein
MEYHKKTNRPKVRKPSVTHSSKELPVGENYRHCRYDWHHFDRFGRTYYGVTSSQVRSVRATSGFTESCLQECYNDVDSSKDCKYIPSKVSLGGHMLDPVSRTNFPGAASVSQQLLRCEGCKHLLP